MRRAGTPHAKTPTTPARSRSGASPEKCCRQAHEQPCAHSTPRHAGPPSAPGSYTTPADSRHEYQQTIACDASWPCPLSGGCIREATVHDDDAEHTGRPRHAALPRAVFTPVWGSAPVTPRARPSLPAGPLRIEGGTGLVTKKPGPVERRGGRGRSSTAEEPPIQSFPSGSVFSPPSPDISSGGSHS